MDNFNIGELQNIINIHNNINNLWKSFLEKNECSPELKETIDQAVNINSKLIVDAKEELNRRNGENK